MTATSFSGSGASLTGIPFTAITGTATFTTLSTITNGNSSTPQLGTNGGTGDRLILFGGTASAYPYSLGINSAVLWYSVPATASHIFYVAGSPIANISSTGIGITGTLTTTGTISEGGTLLTSKYVQLGTANSLTGNQTISGDLILNGGNLMINKPSTVLTLSATAEDQEATILLGTPFMNTGAYKCAIIAKGANSFSRSVLHFCFNDVADNARPTQNATISNSKVSIDYNGNTFINGKIFADASLLNNLKLENQPNFTYPPSALTASSTTIINSQYAGVYTITASTTATGKEPFKCFNLITSDEWSPSTASYTAGTGNY